MASAFSFEFWQKVKIWLLGGRLNTCYQIQAFQGFSLNFLILNLRSFGNSYISGDTSLVPLNL